MCNSTIYRITWKTDKSTITAKIPQKLINPGKKIFNVNMFSIN